MERKYLVFVRAGQKSLHPEWLMQEPYRNWDCVVSWWGSEPEDCGEEYRVTGGALKCDAFAEYYAANPGISARYRFVLIADDDIRIKPGDISRIFETCERHGLVLAQPALGWKSWVNHPITLRNPFTTIRAVTFVEMMMPVFSAATLGDLIHTFKLTKSGSGVDWAWAHYLRGRNALHIIDAVACEHTKRADPVHGALYVKMRAEGVDPWAEYQSIQERFPIAGGIRPLSNGHQLRPWVPAFIGTALVLLHWQLSRVIHGARLLWSSRKGAFMARMATRVRSG